MYYATYKNIGETDIAAFKTEQQRDDWVNFNDEFSKAHRTDSENFTFDRIALTEDDAELRIKNMVHTKDDFNPGQDWYIVY